MGGGGGEGVGSSPRDRQTQDMGQGVEWSLFAPSIQTVIGGRGNSSLQRRINPKIWKWFQTNSQSP